MSQAAQTHDAAVAVTRFGLGARPGELDSARHDPRGWLEAQIAPRGSPNPDAMLPSSGVRLEQWQAYRTARRSRPEVRETAALEGAVSSSMVEPLPEALTAFDARRESRRQLTRGTGDEFLARSHLATTTASGFAERWAMFWANTFTVSATQFQSSIFIGPYEREAIRPNVFGRFKDLAVAAETHPAMLFYLDQHQSIGPNSRLGARREAGLNENLAREIMELHTVGSDSGYSQADVTEFARALTGWTVDAGRGTRRAAAAPGERGFVFRRAVHEPGARAVMGRTYAEGGFEQGRRILGDLANRPETARRLAWKLAAHFIADAPPPSLVERLERTWTSTGGDLASVARALVTAPESWTPQPLKFKTPYELIVSAHRALDTQPGELAPLRRALAQMGQPMYAPPSPEGWLDTVADWSGPSALVKRLNWAKAVGDRARHDAPDALAVNALGARLSERTLQFVSRAESRAEAITLFLMSPEFQRR